MNLKKIVIFVIVCVIGVLTTNAQTKLEGSFPNVKSVKVKIKALNIDTTIVLNNGQLLFNCSVVSSEIGYLIANNHQVAFIPDGSTIKFTTTNNNGEEEVLVSSLTPNSYNNDFAAFDKYVEKEGEEFSALLEKARQMGNNVDEDTKNQVKTKWEAIAVKAKDFVKAHPNSPVIAYIIRNYRVFDDDNEFVNEAKNFGKDVKANSYIANRLKSIENLNATAVGKKFIDFTIANSNGKEEKLSNYVGKGKYVLVDFWASWCGPCKGEIPNIIKVYNKYKGDKFDVLGVAVWDKPEDSIKAAHKLGINYNEIINAGSVPTDIYGIQGIPEIILFSPDGTILARGLRGDDIEKEVAKYIK